MVISTSAQTAQCRSRFLPPGTCVLVHYMHPSFDPQRHYCELVQPVTEPRFKPGPELWHTQIVLGVLITTCIPQ